MKHSISETNSALNKENLQITYFKEKNYSEKTALIIENNETNCKILQDYLQDLGIVDVCVCHSGHNGSMIYNDLRNLHKIPLVFLSDNVSDIDHVSYAAEMLDLMPKTKIILCTANNENNKMVKEMIDIGIFAVLQKPFRFSRLEEIFKIMLEESTRENIKI